MTLCNFTEPIIHWVIGQAIQGCRWNFLSALEILVLLGLFCAEKKFEGCMTSFDHCHFGSKLTYPYGRSNFQIHFFAILIADSDSSQKSVYTNCSSFFKIQMKTLSKIPKTSKKEGKFNLCYFLLVFSIFDNVLI